VKRILLLPFCLSKEEQAAAAALAAGSGYAVVVAQSTSAALSEVRRHVRRGTTDPVRIVGVVCRGRAKKVWLALLALKARQFGKRLLFMPTRRIELAHVPIVGGSSSLFGRRECDIGRNTLDLPALRSALAGANTFVVL
jgi:hypothetical protein